MTNEEKAKEIASKNKIIRLVPVYDLGGKLIRYEEADSWTDCFISAMAMAKWKEKQMIDKAVNFLNENLMRTLLFDKYDKENFIEQLKKAMEEQL